MTDDARGVTFFRRWSRLKQEARNEAVETRQPAEPAPPAPGGQPDDVLPPIESLTLESDYRAFLRPKVEEGVRRAALKRLFQDPHFNVMDGLDVYIDDYSSADPLPEGMLAQLEQARKIVSWSAEDAARGTAGEAGAGSAAARPAQSGGPEATHDDGTHGTAREGQQAQHTPPPRNA